jgi:hypothetical protein
MTVPYWGRITPTQHDMLMMAGHVVSRSAHKPPGVPPDEDRLAAMRTGREGLRRRTGRDRGYDLGAWHELLMGSEGDEWGYRHPWSWARVRAAVERAIDDPDRSRLVMLLEQEG